MIRYSKLDEARPYDVSKTGWGGDTQLFMIVGQSLAWDGNSSAMTSWYIDDTPTPGDPNDDV
jgi:hypothetical protein